MIHEFDTLKRSADIIVKSVNDSVVTNTSQITYDLFKHQNDSIFQIVLEYMKVLIWPIVIVVLVIIFRGQIKRLFERIINESDEISSSTLGLSAKFRRDLAKATNDSSDSLDLKNKIENTIKQNHIDEFKILSSYFFTKPFQARKQAAAEIYKMSQNLSIEDLLAFVTSPLAGERVGSFVGIKSHLDNFTNLEKDERISEAIRNGLDDGYSRVRFRVVQAISSSVYLINMFRDELETLLKEDTNQPVKNEINNVLDLINKN